MEKLAAVESILGSSISAIDTKTEQEKLTLDAKNKAKKLFGDAKERKDAKKKEKKGMVETLEMFFSPETTFLTHQCPLRQSTTFS